MSHILTPERLVLLLVIACSMGVVLGMYAQNARYRKEFDDVYALIDRKTGIRQEPENSTPAPDNMADLDPRNYRDSSRGLDARAADLKDKGYPGTQDIPVITDKMTKEDVTGDTVEGRVVDTSTPEGLWPASDTLAPADAGEFPGYSPWGGQPTADIVAEIEARVIREMKEEALVGSR